MSIVLQPHILERLRTDELAWLTTVRSDGRPHSVPLWFLWENSAILIFSKQSTQKIRNLRHNHFITFALADIKNGHDVVILEGTAELLQRGQTNEALQAYGEKYREGLQRIGVPVEAFTTLYSQPIRITPARLIAWQ